MTTPLTGRVALVTGLSRRIGIGYAIVDRLLSDGASVLATGWSAHDAEMPWGTDPFDTADFDDDRFAHTEADLSDPAVPAELVATAVERFGALDIVVANHARSSSTGLADVTVEELDLCWQINTRGSLLLAQAFDRTHDGSRPGGRMIMFTSGQAFGPMDSEIAYAVSKGAIHQMTASIANHLADKGVTVNTINPGPVDTGYATGEIHARVARAFPAGRWGQPSDVANLVAWLVTDEAAWINGQVINSEGGWRRSDL
jgi:3-oxoacyl-[acyl-carrier protein] reductase